MVWRGAIIRKTMLKTCTGIWEINWLLREQVNYLDDEHTYINKSLQYREILSDLLQDDQEGQERTHAHQWNSGLPDNDKEAT